MICVALVLCNSITGYLNTLEAIMSGENFRDIQVFLAVARERSFTRAAAQLGVSQSALSHTIRGLESRLGLRLLARTTRSVAPTEAGERLINSVGPRFEVIMEMLSDFEQRHRKPNGRVRIAASDFAINSLLWPKLSKLQQDNPDINIEIITEQALSDIPQDQSDASVRFGDQISKDVVATRISADIAMTIVAAPSYLEHHGLPKTPSDLTHHIGINASTAHRGEAEPWTLKKGKKEVHVHVEGAWAFSSIYAITEAALAGFGLAYIPEELAHPYISTGHLQPLLKEWCVSKPGLFLMHSNRRQPSPALALVIATLGHSSE